MKALEFETKLRPDHTLVVPSKTAEQIATGETMRVLLLVPEETPADEWTHLTTEQFLDGYAESDSIYDL